MPPKILIIEDDTDWQFMWKSLIGRCGEAVFVEAATLTEAMAAAEEHADIAAVVVDGCFPREPGGDPYPERGMPCAGEKFVLWFRRLRPDFAGEIFAGSSDGVFNARMVAAGATLAAAKGCGYAVFARIFASKPAS